MATGVDYSGSRPDPHALAAAGIKFVLRYLCPDTADNQWKRVTAPEAGRILSAGLDLAFVFEWGKTRLLAGRGAGQADAANAQAQLGSMARDLGLPGMAAMAVIFTADWDVQPSEVPAVLAYLDGAHSQLGNCAWNPGWRRAGIYGGYRAVSAALNAGKASYAMQTYAWSPVPPVLPKNSAVITSVAGKKLPGRFLFDTRAQIRQGPLGTVAGADVDWDQSMTADYAQYRPPAKAAATADEELLPEGVALPEQPGQSRVVSWPAGAAKGFTVVTASPVTYSVAEFHTDPEPKWYRHDDVTTSGRAVRNFGHPADCTAVRLTLTSGEGPASLHAYP